jgi:hypothetical protein
MVSIYDKFLMGSSDTPAQVTHYAAVLLGCTLVLWIWQCGTRPNRSHCRYCWPGVAGARCSRATRESGLSNKSFDGLPIDSNGLAV